MAILAGWGANLRANCFLAKPETPQDVGARLDRAGTIARGLGRSYGDPALNTDRQVLDMTRVDRYLAFDEDTGTLTCEAGISLAQIIADFTPRGWFPMITPGTKFVTVGGCIANDVHGKAHHAQGSFASCVDAITVLLASGEVVRASRGEHSDLFWASFGGMGLLGIVLTATMRLRKIDTTYFRQKSVAVSNLTEMLEVLERFDQEYPYSVATVDVYGKGASLGRGVIAFGDHALRDELPAGADPLKVSSPPRLSVPFELPELTLNRLSIRAVNAFAQLTQKRLKPIGHYEGFFYPLDMIGHWNRGYGRRGFAQYQFVIPFEDGEARMRHILEFIFASGELPFLNVLKRMGPASGGGLSFPREGFTFAIDFPVRDGTVSVLRQIDELVRDAGGRIYLGKDSVVEAGMFRAMYPEIDAWLAVKERYDPRNVFTSNLARRIGLLSETSHARQTG